MKKLSCWILCMIISAILAGCTPYTPTTAGNHEPTQTTRVTQTPTITTAPTPPEVTEPATPTESIPVDVPHIHNYFGETVDATCTEQGHMLHLCACGDSFTDTFVEALGHAWGDWVTTKEPTAEEEGQQQRRCDRCEESETQKLDRLPAVHVHSYTQTVIAPTCDAGGYTIHTCSCGDTYQGSTVSALGHSFTNYKSNGDATCTDSGTKTAICDRCEAASTIADNGSALGHAWGDWVTTKEPTAEEEGQQQRRCDRCEKSETQKLDRLPAVHVHSYTQTVIAPTCDAGGYTIYTCSCGDTYQGSTVSALGHSFTNYKSNGDATCTDSGTKTAKCDRCEAASTIADNGSALGHAWSEWVVTKEPTTTSEGTKTRTCNRCGVTDSQAIDKHSHIYTTKIVDPTCTADGYTHYSCTCGDTYEGDVVKALGHSFTAYKSNSDATCTADGTKTAKCDRCAATSTIADTGSALGHAWSEWVVTKEPTAAVEGIKTRTCFYCGATDNQIIEKHKHVYSAKVVVPTCIADGYTQFSCTCGDTYEGDVVKAPGHSFTHYKCNGDATCTADGTKTAKCDRCEATSTIADTGSALGHAWGEWLTTKAPTTTSEGVQTRTCEICGSTDSRAIDQLPAVHEHKYTKEKVAATCTEDGYTLYTCECGDCYQEPGAAAKGHSWGNWYVTEDPTTTSTGIRERSCEICSAMETGIVEKMLTEDGFVFVYWTETVGRNEEGMVIIKGQAGVEYTITVNYKSGPATAAGLEPTAADENGYVTWIWKVGGRTSAGMFTIEVTDGENTLIVPFTVEE